MSNSPRTRTSAALRNLSTGRKLALLTAAALLPSALVATTVTVSLGSLEQRSEQMRNLEKASAELFHLDNRNSEIKADAFRSLIETDMSVVAQDTADDIASAEEVLAVLAGLDLPEGVATQVGEVGAAEQGYTDFIVGFVETASEDRAAGLRDQAAIAEANTELDVALETLREDVDVQVTAAEEGVADLQAQMLWMMVAALVSGLLLAVGVAVAIGRALVRRLNRTVSVLEQVSQGDLAVRLDVDSTDEVGRMGTALNEALDRIGEAMGDISRNAETLSTASQELSSVSSQMSGAASESSSQAGLVSAAAEQVSHNVQTVATGTEEMTASIREIARSATDAAQVAAQAVSVADTANGTVAKLGDSSTEIGNVIKVINSIAEQTNLLALNATIEAARAGEAGKGFAVVANEVKDLAQETGKATEDIGRRIEAIQTDTHAAVAAITEIADIIARINDTQTTIASAVEEQTATAHEMARNVSEAATGSADIAQNITGVARSADDTNQAAGSTNQSAEELSRLAVEMQGLVGRFRL